MKYVDLTFLTPTVVKVIRKLFGSDDSDLLSYLSSRYKGIFYRKNKIISLQKKNEEKKYPCVFKLDLDEILDYILEKNVKLTNQESQAISELT
jgi:hypothetical protein